MSHLMTCYSSVQVENIIRSASDDQKILKGSAIMEFFKSDMDNM